MQPSALPPNKLKPPRALLLLLVYTGLFYGLMPIISRIILLFSLGFSWILSEPFSLLEFVIIIIMGIYVIISIIGICKGNVKARNLYLFLIIASSLEYLISSTSYWSIDPSQLPNGQVENNYLLQLIWNIFMHILVPLFSIWYFNQQNTKAFFADLSTRAPRLNQLHNQFDFSLEKTTRDVLTGSLIVVMLYQFISSLPFSPDRFLSMVIGSPGFMFSYLIGLFINRYQSYINLVISPMISTLFWLMIGAVLAYFTKSLTRMILIYIILDVLLMASTFIWLALTFGSMGSI